MQCEAGLTFPKAQSLTLSEKVADTLCPRSSLGVDKGASSSRKTRGTPQHRAQQFGQWLFADGHGPCHCGVSFTHLFDSACSRFQGTGGPPRNRGFFLAVSLGERFNGLVCVDRHTFCYLLGVTNEVEFVDGRKSLELSMYRPWGTVESGRAERMVGKGCVCVKYVI